MSRKNNQTNKKSKGVTLKGGELAAIEQMIIQNSRKTKKNKSQKRTNNSNGGSKGVPIALSNRQETKKPVIRHGPNGSMQVTNREFVASIADAGTGFQQIKRLRVNAASKMTFPWLSTIAKSFENYRFRKLRFRYIPRCASTSQGSILLLPDYDAADTVPLTEEKACQHVNAVEEVIWREVVCNLSPASLNRAYKSHFNVTDGRFAGTLQDQKTIDAAQFFVFVDSTTSGTDGKLWVEYDVDLTTPQPPEDDVSYGGNGMLKNTGLLAGSDNVFTTNAVSTYLQEDQPIVNLLPDSSFPGPNIFRFNRAWSGFIDKQIQGTTITDGGFITRNGNNPIGVDDFVTTLQEIRNAGSTIQQGQIFGTWKEGDLLGVSQITAAALASMILNLGGSSVR